MIHKFSRYLLTLVALFAMTAGAWADNTVYTSGQSVRIVDLKVGDIILPGATVTRDGMSTPSIQRLKFRRCTTEWVDMTESLPVTFDENAGLGDYHVGGKPLQPIDENGNVGNAWQVAVLTLEPFGYIATLDGITYRDPNAPVISEDGTEAEFEMPGNDVTVDYELVRDMAVDMPITVGTGQDNYRIRVKKEGDSFVPAEMTLQQMMALFNVHDGIENQDLVFYGDGKVCDISIFAVDDQGQPTGDAIAFQSLTPGRYVAIATAVEGTIYDGQTGQSNIFTLFEGFEVEVAAQGFATYYKDEALTLDTDETAAALYTVSSVTANEAVLSNAIEAAPANTPLLIYNSSNEPKTVLLIPTDEPNLALTVAPEFQGTLEAKTFTADDMAAYNHYMLTDANAFVWVREAGTIAANRCWLQIAASAPTKARKLVFGEATGLKAIDNGERTIDNWYDLNGRKLNAVPTKKGVYIMNGKKVVVK